MAVTVYVCSGCRRCGTHKGNMQRHVSTCGPEARLAQTVPEVNIGENLTEQTRTTTVVEGFLKPFATINGDKDKKDRAKYMYDTSAIMSHINESVCQARYGPLLSFTRFITLFYGYACLRPEWRSVWISDKHIFVKTSTSILKYPKDDRHKILVLDMLYTEFMWTICPRTMDMYIRTVNLDTIRISDSIVKLNNLVQGTDDKDNPLWKETVGPLSWTLKDLCERKHCKSEAQGTLLSHFEGMFWHFTEEHILRRDSLLHVIEKEQALKKIDVSHDSSEDAMSIAPTRSNTSAALPHPDATVTSFICDCGKTFTIPFNAKRHGKSCTGTVRRAIFKIDSIIDQPTEPVQISSVPREVDVRIKVQNAIHRKPYTLYQYILSDIVDCEEQYRERCEMLSKTQVSVETFITFFSMRYGRDLMRLDWILFWALNHEHEMYVVYQTDLYGPVSSVVVAPFKEIWHDVFSIIWKEYKYLHHPLDQEPRQFENGSFPPTFYEICEKFYEEGDSAITPVLKDLMERVGRHMARIRIQ